MTYLPKTLAAEVRSPRLTALRFALAAAWADPDHRSSIQLALLLSIYTAYGLVMGAV